MQFQNLARQIFVQPIGPALLRGAATVGTIRAVLIQIVQHQGPGRGGDQQILEAPGHMRADRFLDIGRCGPAQHARLALRREVIGPEPHQPLAQRVLGPGPAQDMLAQPAQTLGPRGLLFKVHRFARQRRRLAAPLGLAHFPGGLHPDDTFAILGECFDRKAVGGVIGALQTRQHLRGRGRWRDHRRQPAAKAHFRQNRIKSHHVPSCRGCTILPI